MDERRIIKGIEVHTIMASTGYVVFDGRLRVISLSPNHVSVLGLMRSPHLGVFGGKFSIVSGNGYTSPYWKARDYIDFGVEDGSLVVRTDYGVGVMPGVGGFPALPEPPGKLYSVELHGRKVWLSKTLGTGNFKRPRVNRKYVDVGDVFPQLKCGGSVKASTLLQVLEVAWRVNGRGRIGVKGDKLYVTASGGGYSYEAFVRVF